MGRLTMKACDDDDREDDKGLRCGGSREECQWRKEQHRERGGWRHGLKREGVRF